MRILPKLKYLNGLTMLMFTALSMAQNADTLFSKSPKGLEAIVVETYAIHPQPLSDSNIRGVLTSGFVTYRIFVDLAPGYRLQALYGAPGRPLKISTTTSFFNFPDYGAKAGGDINDRLLNNHNLAFDSWISLGAATQSHLGILKSEDSDGSLLKYSSLREKDGLIAGKLPEIHYYNLIPFFFQRQDSFHFEVNNGSWAIYEGVAGQTDSNTVLVAQLTTDGAISLSLNIQLISPERKIERFVSTNPKGYETIFTGLNINQLKTNENGTKYFTQYNYVVDE